VPEEEGSDCGEEVTFMARLSLVVLQLSLPLASSCSRNEEPVTPTPEPVSAAASTDSVAPTASVPATTTTPPPAAATPKGIASADGERPGVTATITELKRSSGGLISLKMTIVNASDANLDVGYAFGDGTKDFGTFGALQLIDPVGRKKYFVARDTEGSCVCSRDVKDVKKGETLNVWAKFPAPPPDVQKVSVVIPHFTPLDDVPISQ
jgi:hypothetical protein